MLQQDEAVWRIRPVTSQMLDAANKNVVHLRSLRQVLMEEMMRTFINGVDIYLQSYRCSSDDDYQKLTVSIILWLVYIFWYQFKIKIAIYYNK